jgi:hypothetical protein
MIFVAAKPQQTGHLRGSLHISFQAMIHHNVHEPFIANFVEDAVASSGEAHFGQGCFCRGIFPRFRNLRFNSAIDYRLISPMHFLVLLHLHIPIQSSRIGTQILSICRQR